MSNKKLTGRNLNRVEIFKGEKCLKKNLIGNSEDISRRKKNLEKWQVDCPRSVFTPKLVQKNDLENEYYYEWIDSSQTVQEKFQEYLEDGTDESIYKIFQKMAYFLAQIHNCQPSSDNTQFNSINVLSRPLIALNTEEYARSSGAELECISLLQHDRELIEALCSYSPNEKFKSMIHGDVRLDQFLFSPEGKVWIIDFEEYGYGDILKDISGVVGSILFEMYIKIFSSNWEIDTRKTSKEEIENYLVEKEKNILARIVPLLKYFLNQYSQFSKREIDYDLFSMNIGAFLLERVISRSKLTFRLSAIDKAILGVGRKFIISKGGNEQLFA